MDKRIRIIIVLICITALASVLLVILSSCSIIEGFLSGHKHDFVETVTAPTCTEEGYTVKKCECGEEKTENKVAALGHDYAAEFTVDEKATCTQEGSKSRHCSRCDAKTNITVVEPLGHSYAEAWTIDKQAQCVAEGSKSHHCMVCGEKTDITVVDALGHDFAANWTVDTQAQCETAGKQSRHCSRCDETTDVQSIKELGHDYATTYTVDKKATCEADGSESKHCSRCNSSIDSRAIAKLGHDYSSTFTTDYNATCTSNGQRSRHCSRCSSKINVTVIPSLGHNYSTVVSVDKAATCTEDGQTSRHCTRCTDKTDIKVIAKLGHDITSQNVVAPTCLEKGYTQYNCSRCDGYRENEKAPLGHSIVKGKCERCSFADANYYVVKLYEDKPCSWVSGGRTVTVRLDLSIINLIGQIPNGDVTIDVDFEIMYRGGFGTYDGFCLGGEQPYFSTRQEGSEKYYCDSIAKTACNMSTYTKISTGAKVPAKSILEKNELYLTIVVPYTIHQPTWYLQNLTIGIWAGE